jgi:hypothetical protein
LLAHCTPRQEYEEIDRKISKNQQGYGAAGEDACPERDDPHRRSECFRVYVISRFGGRVCRRRLNAHRSFLFAAEASPKGAAEFDVYQKDTTPDNDNET